MREGSTEDDGLQSPLVHEGAESDAVDSNEEADDKVTVTQPSGKPLPEVERKR